jgi:hypothetical protein
MLAIPQIAWSQTGIVLTGVVLTDGGEDEEVGVNDPVASAAVSRETCYAPCPVHFDGRASTDPDLASETAYRLDLTYAWDFGDPGAGEWTYGIPDSSQNVDTEFVAAHVYDLPGVYTWRLIVTDSGGNSDTITGNITVTSTDAAFPTTQTVCIGATTLPVQGVGGCPSGAAAYNAASDFDAAFNTGCDADGVGATDKRCLFKRGDSLSGDQVEWTPNAHVFVGAYGTGADPIITCAGGCFIGPESPTTDRLTVTGITWIGDGTDPNIFLEKDARGANGTHNGYPLRHILVYQNDLSLFSVNWFVNTSGGEDGFDYDPDIEANVHSDVFVFENVVHDDAGTSNSTFFEADKSALMGNFMGQKPGEEHVIRSGHTRGTIIGHNDLGDFGTGDGCGPPRHVFKWHNSETPQSADHNEDGVFVANHVKMCADNDIAVDIGPQDASSPDQAVINSVASRNWFDNGENVGGPTAIQVTTGPNAFRGNIFNLSATASAGTIIGIFARRRMAGAVLDPDGLRIDNNTCYADVATPGAQTCISLSSEVTDARVNNTLVFDPGASIAMLSDSGVNTTTCASCNLEVSSTPFVSTTPVDYADFELHATSAAKDIGELQAMSPINYTGINKPEASETNLDAGAWQRSNTPASVGFNASRTGPDRTNIVFADLMKGAGGSSSGAWTNVDAGTPTFDANGYPTGVVSGTNRVTIDIIDPPDCDYPSGSYSLQVTGSASVVLSGDASGTYSSGTHAVAVTATCSGIDLRVESGTPTNLKFIQPGYAASDTFTTEYLDKLRGSGAVRFMAWSRMNYGSPAPEFADWSQRILTTSVTQAGFGGPAFEYAIELANTLDTDLWLTVPHAFTGAAMASLATLVEADLEAGLNVYVEYSNEIWNGSFDQGEQIRADGDVLWSDTSTATILKARYAAKQTAAIGDAFRAAFADDSRVRIVLGIQSGQSGTTHYNERLLEAFSQTSIAGVDVNPNSLAPYLYAGAPYFGSNLCEEMDLAGTLATATVDDVVNALYNTYLPEGVARVETDVAVATAYNASKGWTMLVGQYEGGTANENTGETGCSAVAFDSQRHAGMREVMRRYIRDIFAAEGALRGIYMHYNSPESYGDVDGIDSHVFGLIESSQDDETTVPKWQGWQDVIR